MQKFFKSLMVLLMLSITIFSFGCKKDDPTKPPINPPPIITVYKYCVKTYALDFTPISGIKIYDDNNNVLCATKEDGTAEFESSKLNPFTLVEMDQNKFSHLYTAKNVVIKDENYKNICFVSFPMEVNAEFKFFLDDANSTNELIEENFITMHGKVAEHYEYRPLEEMEFRINGNLVGKAMPQGNFQLETMFYGQKLQFVYTQEIISMKYGFTDLPNKDFIILAKDTYPLGGNGFRFILANN